MEVGLDPDDVFASSVTPFGEDFTTPLETLACAAANPHKDKGGICGEGGYGEFLELIPAKRGRERGIKEDHVEFEGVEGWELLQRQVARRCSVGVDRLFFEIEQSLLLGISGG